MIKDKITNLILLLNNYGLKKEAAELSVIVKKSGIDFRVDEETRCSNKRGTSSSGSGN
jgi:hypothetical protein